MKQKPMTGMVCTISAFCIFLTTAISYAQIVSASINNATTDEELKISAESTDSLTDAPAATQQDTSPAEQTEVVTSSESDSVKSNVEAKENNVEAEQIDIASPIASQPPVTTTESSSLSSELNQSNKSGPRKLMLLMGPGLGIGFMYPKEINKYIEGWMNSIGAVELNQGSTAMVVCLQPRFSITFAPIEYVQLQFVGEIGWSPKVIAVIGGNSKGFHFLRASTGGTISGHIPISNGRCSVSIGGGVLFNYLKFENLKEITPGYRGLFAFRFYTKKAFTPEIFVEFNWIKADTGRDPGRQDPMEIGELSFISGVIGANLYFKVVEKK